MTPNDSISLLGFTVKTEDNSALKKLASVRDVKLIEFYTMDIEQLAEVAKYRVLPVPTLLVLNKTKVVARMVGNDIPSPGELKNLLELIEITN